MQKVLFFALCLGFYAHGENYTLEQQPSRYGLRIAAYIKKSDRCYENKSIQALISKDKKKIYLTYDYPQDQELEPASFPFSAIKKDDNNFHINIEGWAIDPISKVRMIKNVDKKTSCVIYRSGKLWGYCENSHGKEKIFIITRGSDSPLSELLMERRSINIIMGSPHGRSNYMVPSLILSAIRFSS